MFYRVAPFYKSISIAEIERIICKCSIALYMYQLGNVGDVCIPQVLRCNVSSTLNAIANYVNWYKQTDIVVTCAIRYTGLYCHYITWPPVRYLPTKNIIGWNPFDSAGKRQ